MGEKVTFYQIRAKIYPNMGMVFTAQPMSMTPVAWA